MGKGEGTIIRIEFDPSNIKMLSFDFLVHSNGNESDVR